MEPQPGRPDRADRLLAALAYPIPFVLALVIVATDIKRDPYMARHGWTALFWSVGWTILFGALKVVLLLPLLGWLVFFVTYPLFLVAFVILSLYYGVQAYEDRRFTIPVVSDWATRYMA